MRPYLRLISLIGVIVPRRLRVDWRQEWEAELRHREDLLANWHRLNWRNKLDLVRRSIGAFWDALWLQTHRWEDAMIQDLRFGVRMLLKHKGFTGVAVLTLAFGIRANTAIFTVINALLLRSLPVKAPDELVLLASANRNGAPPERNPSARIEALSLPSTTSPTCSTSSFATLSAFPASSVSLTFPSDG